MQSYLHGLSSGPDWKTVCREAIAALGRIPADAGLGFAYFTDPLCEDLAAVLDYLQHHTPVKHWVGTSGHGIMGTGVEVYETPALSLLITDLAEDDYRLLPDLTTDARHFLADTRSWREQHLSSFSVVHGNPSNPKIPNLISQYAQSLDGGFLVGGLSSGASEIFPQLAGQVQGEGLSGVLLAADVPVATGLSQGCSLIGQRHEITAADGNIAKELDGRPALDVFKEDIGEVLARDLERAGAYIFAALPVPGSDTGDYLVRNLLGFDPESKALAIGNEMRAGTPIQFARRDADSARKDLKRMLCKLKKRLTAPPKGALYVSCLGRGQHLFGKHSEELQLISQELGDLPLTGFYANGEISHNRLYGYTGVLTVFQ